MPLKVRALGEEVSIMRIGTRQLKLRGPRKRNKPLMVIKSKSVPSHTPYWLQAAVALADAAIEMRGRTLEEVVTNVINKCSGKQYLPDSVKAERKRARYVQADANVARLKKELERAEIKERMAMLPGVPA